MISNPDIHVCSLVFAVDRSPNAEWHLTDNINHDFYVLAYAKSGSAVYTFGNETVRIKKGDIVFIRQGQRYSARSDPDDPWHFISVAFSVEFRDEESRAVLHRLPNRTSMSGSSHLAQNFAELCRIRSAENSGYLIKCRSLILDLLYSLLYHHDHSQHTGVHDRKLEQIIDMMRENISRSYSLAELCEMSGLSSSHFRMLFKERTGMTTVQFQNHLKINHAKDLILSRTCNVTEAAYAVGFNDIYYFSRLFRKLTGKNPSEYLR